MQMILALALVLPSFLFQQPPASVTDAAAYAKIGAEKNPEAKKKLMLAFERNFPKSIRLPEVYIELSKTLVSQSDFATAEKYAEKAVSTVARMKSESAASEIKDSGRQAWLNTLDTSVQKNLAWTKQMLAWQMQELRSNLTPKR
jgi:hypothetical protein